MSKAYHKFCTKVVLSNSFKFPDTIWVMFTCDVSAWMKHWKLCILALCNIAAAQFLSVFFVRSNVCSSDSLKSAASSNLARPAWLVQFLPTTGFGNFIPLVYWECGHNIGFPGWCLHTCACVCAGWMKCHHIGSGSKGSNWQKIMPMSLCTVMFLGLLIWELFAFEPEISFEWSGWLMIDFTTELWQVLPHPKGLGVSPLWNSGFRLM